MSLNQSYFETNRKSWNNRVDAHIKSEFYDQQGFLNGKTSLNPIELNLLGDIRGKSVLHLQCHFGQDSISLSRMGAKVTGVDLSDKAIEKAREIAEQTNSDTQFICCNVYDLDKHLDDSFDIVFSSYGTIGWLPDLDKWAAIVSRFLKPGGKFIYVEFHPVVWMFDDNFQTVKYSYFNKGVILESESGSYADKKDETIHDFAMWNHGLSEVFGSLLRKGLTITQFDEFDYSPYDCFNGTEEIATNRFRIKTMKSNLPMVFSLVAEK